ncbi:MAG TPA: amidohydrolase family protein [Chthoniobacterales bacterium]
MATATLLIVTASSPLAQQNLESDLLAEINKIKAIDHHAHPVAFTGPKDPRDMDFDALTGEGLEMTGPPPLRMRPDNPEYIGAWRALFGYNWSDMSEEHVRGLAKQKQAAMAERGERYPAWVLDRLGIETMFANRVSLGRGQTAPRFRWVAFDDALIFPLNNERAEGINSDYASFYKDETKLLKRYLSELHLAALPETLSEYVAQVVAPVLEHQKATGAVAIKFEAAYLRSLEFADPAEADAAEIYGRYAKGDAPSPADYKVLQDFLFRRIAREAGRLKLPVHIHCTAGVGSYYDLRTANPLLLETVFNDPKLRQTNFVLIHGGWPFTKEVAHLFSKPNVYADFSVQDLLFYPRALSETLRTWLEIYPEKVFFGTDAMSFTPEVNWEETAWLSTTTARQALALALAGMMNDHEIDRPRALVLAEMVMRGNALKLYHLDQAK